jgi:hypothetical protein
VTAIDGTWDGLTITGLVAPNAYVENDNKFFYPSSPYFDEGGILFSLSNDVLVNLYYLAYGDQPPYQGEEVNAVDALVGEVSVGTFSVTPAATPLPGSLPLFATGIAAFGLLYWRRKTKAAVAV